MIKRLHFHFNLYLIQIEAVLFSSNVVSSLYSQRRKTYLHTSHLVIRWAGAFSASNKGKYCLLFLGFAGLNIFGRSLYSIRRFNKHALYHVYTAYCNIIYIAIYMHMYNTDAFGYTSIPD